MILTKRCRLRGIKLKSRIFILEILETGKLVTKKFSQKITSFFLEISKKWRCERTLMMNVPPQFQADILKTAKFCHIDCKENDFTLFMTISALFLVSFFQLGPFKKSKKIERKKEKEEN